LLSSDGLVTELPEPELMFRLLCVRGEEICFVEMVSSTEWIQLDGRFKAIEGLRPSYPAQVRFGEPGAPVQFLLGSVTGLPC
jgi:hypothetical protein